MSGRLEPRIKCVLPVKISGTDVAGIKFEVLTCTLDISDRGARITGVPNVVKPGSALQVTYKNRRATFRVAWAGRRGTRTEDQIGVIAEGKEAQLWPELQKDIPKVHVDEPAQKEHEAQAKVMQAMASIRTSPGPKMRSAMEANERLKAATDEMFELAALIERGDIDAEALHEFRHALGYVRNTSWMLQQWMELQQSGGARMPLLALLNSERLRLASNLCSEVAGFLATAHVKLDLGLVDHFLGVARQLVVVLRSMDRRVDTEETTRAD